MSVRWLVWSLLSPSQILLGLTIVGGLLLALGRGRWGRRLGVAGGLGVAVFGLLPVAHLLADVLEMRFPPPALPERIAGIVLLTGAERSSASAIVGQPQVNWAAGRYVTLLRLSEAYPDAPLVITGGPRLDPQSGRKGQTGVAADILRGAGIPEDRLRFEEGSQDTCDNASRTKALIRPQPGEAWVVVTSAIHLPRAVACFRAAGWTVVPQPADFHSAWRDLGVGAFQIADNLKLLDVATHEWVGLLYYRATGRTRELFPAPAAGAAVRASDVR